MRSAHACVHAWEYVRPLGPKSAVNPQGPLLLSTPCTRCISSCRHCASSRSPIATTARSSRRASGCWTTRRQTPAHAKYDGANFYPDHQVGALRPPLRRDHRRRPAGRPDAGGAVRLGPRLHLAGRRCLPGRRRPRRDGAVGVDAPRRQVARRPGQDRDRPGGRIRRHLRRPVHADGRAGRPRHRRRQRPGRQRLGHLHHRHDHPDRDVHGHVDVRVAQGPDRRGHGDRRRRHAGGGGRRRAAQPPRLDARQLLPPVAHADRPGPLRLRLHRLGAAGVAAARAARLPRARSRRSAPSCCWRSAS